MDREAKERLD